MQQRMVKKSGKREERAATVFTFPKKNGILSVMKKIIAFIPLFLLSLLIFPKGTVLLGPYVGYWSPANDTLKTVYDGEDIIYGGKLGIRLGKGFSVWLSGMQYRKSSKTIPLEDITTLTLNPINLSLRYTFRLGTVNPYLEGGYTYTFYKEVSDISEEDTKGEGRGFSLDAGIEFRLSSNFTLDVGARYSKTNVNPSGDEEIDIGGLQGGIALLIVF